MNTVFLLYSGRQPPGEVAMINHLSLSEMMVFPSPCMFANLILRHHDGMCGFCSHIVHMAGFAGVWVSS